VRRIRLLILPVLLLTLVVAMTAAAEPAAAQGGNFMLTLLHNNDAESQLINAGSGLEDFGGVARFATLVQNLKRSAETGPPPAAHRGVKRGVIMVSSGDNFLAGPEFNASLEKGVPFYDTIAMDLIGYDAVAIGNHDFDFGPDVLADFISGYQRTRPPYLSANLDFSGEPRLQELVNQGRIAPSTVVKVRGENIGIIGATTTALPFISSPRNVIVNEVAPAVQAEIDRLRSKGVNIIILISHLQSIDEDLMLAPMLEGVDIMVAGGGDELLANEGDLLLPGHEQIIFGPYPMIATDKNGAQIPVVTTPGSYNYVGKFVAIFDRQGNLIGWDDDLSGPVRVAGGNNPDAVQPHPQVQALVVDPVQAALNELANNVIATSEVGLDGIRTNVRTRETNEGNLIADAMLWQATQLAGSFGVPTPDIALQNGGGIRNDTIIGPGNITELHTFDMLPFGNFLSIVPNVPREQFKEILENAVSRVENVDGRFAQVAGFSFTWDAAGTPQVLNPDGTVATPGTRVIDVTLDDGTPIVQGGVVVPGDPLTIAVNNFLAMGGDQYPFRGAAFTNVGVSDQQALENYIVQGLGGLITAADYPEGGEGRITRLN